MLATPLALLSAFGVVYYSVHVPYYVVVVYACLWRVD